MINIKAIKIINNFSNTPWMQNINWTYIRRSEDVLFVRRYCLIETHSVYKNSNKTVTLENFELSVHMERHKQNFDFGVLHFTKKKEKKSSPKNIKISRSRSSYFWFTKWLITSSQLINAFSSIWVFFHEHSRFTGHKRCSTHLQ